VETSATAPPSIMLGAAQCAMVHGAPLLFTSQNPKRQLLVDLAVDGFNNPPPIIIQSQGDVTYCLEMTTDRVDVNGLSTLAGPYPLVQFPKDPPKIPAQPTLAPTVVFAAALEPGFLPDVAVGMALAAHMAMVNGPVSLVVVPRYLEADPKLENRLEGQHNLVSGGVILGQTITVPDDTLALLRQLLTSRNRQGVVAQIQDNLGSVTPVVAALLTLIGLAAADRIGQRLIHPVTTRIEPEPTGQPAVAGQPAVIGQPAVAGQPAVIGQPRVRRPIMGNGNVLRRSGRDGQLATPAGGYWRAALAGGYWRTALGDNRKVTVWLRSGTKVAGIVTDWYPSEQGKDPADVLINAVVRLAEVTLTREGGQTESVEFVLVSVEDIELIAKAPPNQAGSGPQGALSRCGIRRYQLGATGCLVRRSAQCVRDGARREN
jgi:hypothetical protein